MADESEATPDTQAARAARADRDELGRLIVPVTYDAPPTHDELWQAHMQRNLATRNSPPEKKPRGWGVPRRIR